MAFRVPMLKPAEIVRPTPPSTYAPVRPPQGYVSPIATGVGGLIGGAIIGAGWMAAKKIAQKEEGAPAATEKQSDNSGTSSKE